MMIFALNYSFFEYIIIIIIYSFNIQRSSISFDIFKIANLDKKRNEKSMIFRTDNKSDDYFFITFPFYFKKFITSHLNIYFFS
jgi:hypothetical protein